MSIWAVGIELRVEAETREEAEGVVREQLQRRRIHPAWDVHVAYVETFEGE